MSYYRQCTVVLALLALAMPARAGMIEFTDPNTIQTFTVPDGVTSIHVLAIGGGAGGAAGLLGGGGSGYLETGVFSVTAGSVFAVGVGAGGAGVTSIQCGNMLCGIGNGGFSWFGDLLVAKGGSAVGLSNGTGNDGGSGGGSGGGAACNAGSLGGTGGSGGSNGSPCANGRTTAPGQGQGNYAALLADFQDITAGEGGAGGSGTHGGGGGAGGVLVKGEGPKAGDGSLSWSAKGGWGFGAGGGSGSFDYTQWPMYGMGGSGASGLVLVQYNDHDVPAAAFKTTGSSAAATDVAEPTSLAILGTALLAGGLAGPIRRRLAGH